jgi:hypothetical protein
MKRLLKYLFITIVCTSCDPGYIAEIKNETQNDILVQIKFDRAELESRWNGESFLPYLNSFPGYGDIDPAITIDTITLKYTYKIAPEKTFILEDGLGSQPYFSLIQELLILKPDSILLRSKTEIKSAFTENETSHWQLKIK